MELVKEYFFKKYFYEEISGVLKKRHNISLSARTVRRIVKRNNLKRKNVVESSIEEILATVIFEIDNTALNLGYRAMTHRLKSQYHLLVKHSTVLKVMRLVDPAGVEARSRYRLKRRIYAAHGPNFAWHIDGHDKLLPYGFAIHGCTDGFSRMVMWLRVSTSNKNPKIVAYYYLQCVKTFGFIPSIIVSDKGSENTVIDVLHIALRTHDTDEYAGENSFRKGKSTKNERIEKYWKHLRESTLDYYIDLFKMMQESGVLDVQDEIHVEALRFCFSSLIQRSLNKARTEWNEHRIQKQANVLLSGAIPNVMFYWPERYGCEDYSKNVNKEDIDMMLEDYAEKPINYSSDIEELIKILVPNVSIPQVSKEAYDLFVKIIELMNS